MKILTVEQVQKLADIHINRYSSMIRASDNGRRGIRVSECEELRMIWKDILESLKCQKEIDKHGKQEISDALFSGDHLDIWNDEDDYQLKFPFDEE
jgi:hypothetical protein